MANLLVFVPLGFTLGMALRARGRQAAWGAVAGTAFSVAVELAQGAGIAGRFASLGDVLTNGLGAALGALLAAHARALAQPSPRTARRGLAAALAGSVGASALSAWLMQRAPGPGPWPPRVAAARVVPGMGWYAGQVAQAAVDGRVVRQAGSGPTVVDARVGADVRVDLALTGGDRRPSFVPYVLVQDGRGRPQVVVGQQGDDAVAEVRLRAGAWRLHAPRLVVPGGARVLRRGDGSTRGTVRADYAAGTLRLAVWAGGRRWSGAVRLSPAQAWALVTPFGGVSGWEGAALTAAWLAVWALPVGYWAWWCAVRADGPLAGRAPRALGPALAVAGAGVVALAAIPLGFGFAPVRWWEWGAALVGLAAGGTIAAAFCQASNRRLP